jgi:hypothetical protein
MWRQRNALRVQEYEDLQVRWQSMACAHRWMASMASPRGATIRRL